ncbi:MAG: dynamin family protein [Thermoanaerobaculales bacterium]|jgi:GTP-binding protein EngB required for normal cell division|nr:dynamin family protein [Thermoanaerobaculales bacterium]
MLDVILTPEQREILRDERALLGEISAALERGEIAAADRRTLADSIRQLDELFLVVVVGEFNAGKSAFINALLGADLLAEGVTPTTSKIHLLTWGPTAGRQTLDAVSERLTAPVEALRHLSLVDTPGTNALDRSHEALTTDYVPRADLVVFVTSADRPFSESERVFLERIRRWGKKVVVVVNKTDILRSPGEVSEVLSWVRSNAMRLLGTTPVVFRVSALRAREARAAGDPEALAASGLTELEGWLTATLDDAERVRLKLGNPLGVAARLLDGGLAAIGARLDVLASDRTTIADIERQTATWTADVEREFTLRLSDIDNVLLSMETRGLEFFDETVRLGRIVGLLDREELQRRFEAEVVSDAPQRIESKVSSLIDWLVASDLEQWQSVVNHVNRRAAAHADRMVGEVGGRFEADRGRLLATVGRAAADGLAGYDRAAEARRMADEIQKAVAGAALAGVGAVGLGAAVAVLASSTAADVTGLLAAGLLLSLGLFILPHRRRRAKTELRAKVASLRRGIMSALTDQLTAEAERSRSRLAATIAPYTRFVRAEAGRLEDERARLDDLARRVESMRARIADLL